LAAITAGTTSWFMSRFQLPEYIIAASSFENPTPSASCRVWFSWTMSVGVLAVAPKPRTASGARATW
jgi:hypothetical protein